VPAVSGASAAPFRLEPIGRQKEAQAREADMKLPEATALIRETAGSMETLCEQPVFDEFGIVQRDGGKHFLCWYQGRRRAQYIRDFKHETALLRRESLSRFFNRYEIGDFEFVPDGAGTQAEGFLVVGDELYLLCTNTVQPMSEITSNPLWLKAQSAFVEMSERFASDPLEIDASLQKQEIRL
jgi:hypothetical protein